MIRLFLVALAAASCALGQNAGAQALVAVDKLPVYAKMNAEGEPLRMLFKGEAVVIGLVLFGDDFTWCAVSKPGETKRLGYVSCESLEPDRASAPSAPSEPQPAPAPPAPKPPKEPVKIREVPPVSAPIRVRELSRKTADELLSGARASGAIPDPADLKTPPVEPPKSESPAPAAPPPDPAAAAPRSLATSFVDFVLDRSGLSRDTRMYVRRTNLTSFLDRGRLAKLDQDLLKGLVQKHFQASEFDQALSKRLVASYDAGHMAALMDWLRSAKAEGVEFAIQAASKDEARQKLVQYAESLSAKPPGEARLQIIHRLHNATRSTSREVRTTLSLVRALAQAVNPLLPAELRFNSKDLDTSLEAVEARYFPIMRNARIVFLLFATRDLPDSELESYTAFWESDTGKWLVNNVDAAWEAASGQMSRNLMRSLPENLRPEASPAP